MALTDSRLPETSAPPRGAEELPTALAAAARSERGIDRAVLIQFVQFCLVGAVSTALNEGLFNLFWTWGINKELSFVLAFSLAVTNGFFLNRAWTFRHSRRRKMEHQYWMFFVVNIVGLGLSFVVMNATGAWLLHVGWAQSLALRLQPSLHRPVPSDHLAYSVGVLVSTVPCSVWNFAANKLWTFGGARSHAA